MAEEGLYLKILTQSLSQGAMRAIGIEDIELAELLPTVLPTDEMRADTVWRMADGGPSTWSFKTSESRLCIVFSATMPGWPRSIKPRYAP